jgi:hypothetical protein
MGENIKNGRKYLILGQNLISSPIFNILPHYEKPGVSFSQSIKSLESIYLFRNEIVNIGGEKKHGDM